jgi:hypothetical protein
MPAIDQCHDIVVRALQKDGWAVHPTPLRVDAGKRTAHIDIEAWRQMNGNSQKVILTEVKCFPAGRNIAKEIYIAIGQYAVYQAIIIEAGLTATLYLAIPEDIHKKVFDVVLNRVVRDHKIKLVIVDLDTETITQWLQ